MGKPERDTAAVGRHERRRRRSVLAGGTVFLFLASIVGPVAPCVTAVASPVIRSPHQRPARAHSSGVQTSPLVRYGYTLVHDSSGWAPSKAAAITLIFSGDGVAFVYSADATECLGDQGSYSYAGGRLSLRFHTPDINVGVTVPLSVAQSEVTMPFQVASAKTGTSLWKQEPLALDAGVFAIFNAEGNNASGNPTMEQASDFAYAYAEAWVAAGSVSVPAFGRPAVRAGAPRLLTKSAQGPGACGAGGANCITSVEDLDTDLRISFKDGPPVVINLYSWSGDSGGSELGTSPLASDPRVHLDPTVHADGQYDPTNKTAVLISPFTYTVLPWPAHTSLESTSALHTMATTLENRGYKVTELLGAASVKQIVDALEPGPGYVMFSTHGNAEGDLLTGETVQAQGMYGLSAAQAADLVERQHLIDEGLKSLVDYDAKGLDPATFFLAEEDCSFLPSAGCTYKVMLTPWFWSWLTNVEHTKFDKSLIFISACLTNRNLSLRDAIGALNYLSFENSVDAKLALAIELYLVKSLARPTRSPEEVYYNMERVQRTNMMIYKQDGLLDGVLGSGPSSISGNLIGWGWDGSKYVSYYAAGFLDAAIVDPSQVWWMLFAGRWDTNVENGAANLTRCFNDYWSKGSPGGLADQFCNAANAGQLKDKQRLRNDIEYAVYLLDGQKPADVPPNEVIPRWTLDDGAK